MPSIEWIIMFLLLGALVGVMAGLLGVGGGGIMVPSLTNLFIAQGMPLEEVVHLALGTSMAAIVATSFSSLRAHHAKAAVIWPIVTNMTVGVVFGALAATVVVAQLNAKVLAVGFVIFMTFVALQMLLNSKLSAARPLSGRWGLVGAGMGIGSISALVSIGGGTLTVPYLMWQNIDIKKAIGTSAAVGFPISIVGSIGYAFYGFIDWWAVLFISMVSFITAPVGVELAHRLPVLMLKKIFALMLVGLSINMLMLVY